MIKKSTQMAVHKKKINIREWVDKKAKINQLANDTHLYNNFKLASRLSKEIPDLP